MIKGLAITPPTVGRISIGRVVEKNGKRLPEKDDQFTLTTQVQSREGWLLHPWDDLLRRKAHAGGNGSSGSGKLRSIPVRMLFDDPALNLRAEYSLFDRSSGRPLCVGNGETCQRLGVDGVEVLSCPSPSLCDFAGARSGTPQCKPYGRLHVRVTPEEAGMEAEGAAGLSREVKAVIEGASGATGLADALDTFVFRTTGFNSIRTLAARLSYYSALSGGLLSCLPLQLKIRGKSTTLSHRTPIFYVDLVIREGLDVEQAIEHARLLHQRRVDAGLDQAALDAAARAGFANAVFESSPDEGVEVLEEFYPEEEQSVQQGPAHSSPEAVTPASSSGHPPSRLSNRLSNRLGQQLERQAKGAGDRGDGGVA